MALLNFRRPVEMAPPQNGAVEALMQGFSLEVMPRTAEKIDDFPHASASWARGSILPISKARRSPIWSLPPPGPARPRHGADAAFSGAHYP